MMTACFDDPGNIELRSGARQIVLAFNVPIYTRLRNVIRWIVYSPVRRWILAEKLLVGLCSRIAVMF